MRGIGMWDSSSISTLFSGFSSSRSSNAASSFIANMDMTTYSGIRSGSYFKLLKSYYGNNLNSKAQSLVSSSVSTSKDSAKTLASIESESEDMVKSAGIFTESPTESITNGLLCPPRRFSELKINRNRERRKSDRFSKITRRARGAKKKFLGKR